MHIGVFTDLFYPRSIGGGENRIQYLMSELVRQGNKVTVVTTRVPGQPTYEVLNNHIRVIRIGWPHPEGRTSILVSLLFVISGIMMLKKLIALEFDIVESNTYFPSYLGAMFSKVTGIPHVIAIYDVYIFDWSFRVGHLLLPFAIFIEKSLKFLGAEIVTTISEASRKKLVEVLGFRRERIVTIPCGVNLEILNTVESSGKERRVIYVGRLVPHKHVDHAIKAFAKCLETDGSLELLIVGTGPERLTLDRLVERAGLHTKVVFSGFVEDHRNVYRLLKESLILVNPSTVEGFGIILIEAMASGVPVVAYDLPAYRDFIVSGLNGILVQPGDIDSLSTAISTLIQDTRSYNRIVENALKTAREFTWSSIADHTLKIYTELRG